MGATLCLVRQIIRLDRLVTCCGRISPHLLYRLSIVLLHSIRIIKLHRKHYVYKQSELHTQGGRRALTGQCHRCYLLHSLLGLDLEFASR